MEDNSRNRESEFELSIQEVLEELWRRKWTIIWVSAACTVVTGIIAWSLPKKYEAVATVIPAPSSSGGGQGVLGSIASQFGGLASLAGFSGNVDPKVSESIAILKSEALTERYIQSNNLLPVLFESRWDAHKMQWKESDPEKIPTLWKANQYFKLQVRAVTSDLKTGLVTVSITWKNPVAAATWANDLIRLTNEYQRNKAIAESERNIAYLNDQAARTTIVEARQAIYTILQSEINKVMLARGSEEYAFRVLDPAVAPEKPSSPQKTVWLIMGMLGGLFLAGATVLIQWSWRSAHSSVRGR